MTSEQMLKIAFDVGVQRAFDEAVLSKEAGVRQAWGAIRRGGRALKEKLPFFGRKAKSGTKLPKIKEVKEPKVPEWGASKAEKELYSKQYKQYQEYAAKKLQRDGYNPTANVERAKAFREAAGPDAGKWLNTVEGAGKTGLLGVSPMIAATAGGAGLGYAVDGREGALIGAGLGAGVGAGTSGLVKNLRRAKGYQTLLGKTPSFAGMGKTEVAKKALGGGLALGTAGAGLGYAAGRATRPPEQPWYSDMGLGLTPGQTQQVAQMAVPALSEQLGLDPTMVQALGEQYGVVPAEQQYQGMPGSAGYYE